MTENKSPSDKIKEAAAGATDPKALSEAAKTSSPTGSPPPGNTDPLARVRKIEEDIAALRTDLNGDGKVTLTERVKSLEGLVEALGKEVIALKNAKADAAKAGQDAEAHRRIDKIEERLKGNIA